MVPVTAPDGAWLAPAKLNLMLRVVGRRADGYHLLQTVFQFIDHCDRLYFEPRPDGEVMRRRGAPGVLPEQDLVVRAARALRRRSGCADGEPGSTTPGPTCRWTRHRRHSRVPR